MFFSTLDYFLCVFVIIIIFFVLESAGDIVLVHLMRGEWKGEGERVIFTGAEVVKKDGHYLLFLFFGIYFLRGVHYCIIMDRYMYEMWGAVRVAEIK